MESSRISGSIPPTSKVRMKIKIPRAFNKGVVKALILNYRERLGGRITDYTDNILPAICGKATTENELQRWHEAVVGLIFKFKRMETYHYCNSIEKGRVPGHLMGVMEALVERAKTVDELGQWAGQVENYVVNRSLFYRIRVLPIIIRKAETLEELEQWHQTAYKYVMSQYVNPVARFRTREGEGYRNFKVNFPGLLKGMRTLEEWLEFISA